MLKKNSACVCKNLYFLLGFWSDMAYFPVVGFFFFQSPEDEHTLSIFSQTIL